MFVLNLEPIPIVKYVPVLEPTLMTLVLATNDQDHTKVIAIGAGTYVVVCSNEYPNILNYNIL